MKHSSTLYVGLDVHKESYTQTLVTQADCRRNWDKKMVVHRIDQCSDVW